VASRQPASSQSLLKHTSRNVDLFSQGFHFQQQSIASRRQMKISAESRHPRWSRL
jgi:hypothetical protein